MTAERDEQLGYLRAKVEDISERQGRHLEMMIEINRKVDGLVTSVTAIASERRGGRRVAAKVAGWTSLGISLAVSAALALWSGGR